MFEKSVYQGETVRGGSRMPTNIEVNETGIGIGVLKKTMHPWSSISEITIDGPESRQSRVTATRLATVGVFAFAAKKNTSETLVIITLKSEEVITVVFNKKAEPEVRAIFAPHLRKITNINQSSSQTNQVASVSVTPQTPKSKAEQIKEIGELYDRGLIDLNEFQDLKLEILQASSSDAEQIIEEKQDSYQQKSISVPRQKRIRDGELDDDGVEYIVRRPSDKVAIFVVNFDVLNIDELTELMMSLERTPPDRKTERKWRSGFQNSFAENIGRPINFVIEMHCAERVIAEFEEFGCEVRVRGTKDLFKSEYKLLELSEDDDPFEGSNPEAVVGIGITSLDGMNVNAIIEILWANALQTPGTVDLFTEFMPHDMSFWFMHYGTSLEIEPKLNALGCRIKRIEILDPEMERIILGEYE
jgi:hypothetical protein